MKCPVDGAELVITDRGGVEIDYCPKCRGVWLDRGELDKIIDRSLPPPAPVTQAEPARARPAPAPDAPDDRRRDRDDRSRSRDHDDDDDDDYRRPKRRKRDSFLSDLFDF